MMNRHLTTQFLRAFNEKFSLNFKRLVNSTLFGDGAYEVKTPRHLQTAVNLVILVTCIALSESVNNAYFRLLSLHPGNLGFVLPLILMGCQVFIAPIQATHSDHFNRKKTLMFALISVIVSAIIFYFCPDEIKHYMILITAILLKGFFGNVFPIALAALADTQKDDFIFSVGLSTGSMALGVILLSLIDSYFDGKQVLIVLVAFLFVLRLLTGKYFYDKESDEPKNIRETLEKSHSASVLDDVFDSYGSLFKSKTKGLRKLLTAFSFWEYSFYLVFIMDVEFHVSIFQRLSLWMCVAYLLGVLLLRASFMRKLKDQTVIRIGQICSFCSIPLFLGSIIFFGFTISLKIAFVVYSIGSGLLIPGLFSLLGKLTATRKHGFIYGLMDSFDTISLVGAFYTAKLIIYFSKDVTSPIGTVVVLISFLTFSVGFCFYKSYKKQHDLIIEK